MQEVEAGQKIVLHVGCGPSNPETLHVTFQTEEWKEVRLDIDPLVKPDIIGDIRNLDPVASESVDAVYSSHNIEHLFDHEVTLALKEFCRVLKPTGFALITVPNIQKIGQYLTEDKLDDVLYISDAGPVAAIDILFGLRDFIKNGNHYMAHKTAFTPKRLAHKLLKSGFYKVEILKYNDELNIWAMAYKN